MSQGSVSAKLISGLNPKIIKGEENRHSTSNLDANVNT